MSSFDYVIIGGGSAGCVAAGRLAADGRRRVLLLEAGDPAARNPETLRADGYREAFINPRLMHERFSTPQPGCGGRSIFLGTGRGLGGSGSINAMVYLRGSRADYREWATPGWSWDEVAGDFEGLEAALDLHRRSPTEFTEACVLAAEHAGFHRLDDLDGGALVGGLGYERMNFSGARRRSSYVAFVEPLLHRGNMVVETGAKVQQILFDERRRAVGVRYTIGEAVRVATARREVVLAAGALESPKLLMLSGIGRQEELRRHGIPAVFEARAVGAGLRDHPNVTLFFRSQAAVDCDYPQIYGFHRVNPASPLPPDQADTCFVMYPARSSMREATMRMLPTMALSPRLYRTTPLPALLRAAVRAGFAAPGARGFVERLYGIVVILGKPRSRGSLRLASTDAAAPAIIDPAYFDDPEDMETMLRGVALARQIAAAPPLRRFGSRELLPGAHSRSQAALRAFIRRQAMTTYHFASTCRMGEDAGAVVDARLRVRGVQGLRIADASVMPGVPVSALNAPSMMIGWRVARFLAEEEGEGGDVEALS